MCPIETPRRSKHRFDFLLGTFCKINEYGFIEAPFRRVDKETGVVSDEVIYMTADMEDELYCRSGEQNRLMTTSFVHQRSMAVTVTSLWK